MPTVLNVNEEIASRMLPLIASVAAAEGETFKFPARLIVKSQACLESR